MELYFEKQEGIKYVKKLNIPFAQGFAAARHFLQEAKNIENELPKDIGIELDPILEQDILECKEDHSISKIKVLKSIPLDSTIQPGYLYKHTLKIFNVSIDSTIQPKYLDKHISKIFAVSIYSTIVFKD